MKLRCGDPAVGYWFTSDFHLGHANIIRYSRRPFRDAAEMDARLLDNCNQYVRERDNLFYLGDWCFCRGGEYLARARQLRERLACRTVYFVWGNHDKQGRGCEEFERLWSGCYDLVELCVLGTDVTLCHYAMRVWSKSHHGAIHLYGHSHASLPELPDSRSQDVGVDQAARRFAADGVLRPENYRPFRWQEILAHMETKTFRPVDHHGADRDLAS